MTSLSCLVTGCLLAKTMEITGSCPTCDPACHDGLVLRIVITVFIAVKMIRSQIREYIFKGSALSYLQISR